MEFITSPINNSPVISKKAGAALADVHGCAVKFDENGNIVLAAAGDTAAGVAIVTNDENIPEGGDVDIQVCAIGLVKAGAAIKPGQCLAPGANGVLVPAESGAYLAIAHQEATAAGELIQAQIVHGSK